VKKRKNEGQILSFWIPVGLRERLDRYQESYVDQSRSKYICSAIQEFLDDPRRKYLVEKPKITYDPGKFEDS
jgi:metal-responsive CopG/Arc/MetJ family transcriptional regulator